MSKQSGNHPIDAVVTWVDGSDPLHEQKLQAYLRQQKSQRPRAAAATRFADRGELEYCVSSLLRFAPWLRQIFIVTDEQTPGFMSVLSSAHRDRVRVVDHKDIFIKQENSLPTFNSLSIETMLWRIPGLSDRFIYFNDDCFLIKPVAPEHFFNEDGVVLRGRFRPVVRPKLTRKLKRLLGRGRSTRGTLQSEAAEMLGIRNSFLDVNHIPHPMRVSTFQAYHEAHPRMMERNASYPLRNVRQFWPIALANHLELKMQTARISETPESLYLSSSASMQDAERLIAVEKRPDCRFLCAQSLDQATGEFMDFWKPWMDRIVGRLQAIPE